MEREFKYRPPGMIFYLFLVLMLLLSNAGIDLIGQLQENIDTPDAVGALVAAGILLFTSEGVGYLFSSVVYAVFNLGGGYSALFRSRLSYGNFKSTILDLFVKSTLPSGVISADQFNVRLPEMSDEALLAYFFWYRDKHKNPLDDWHIRRYTAFFTACSSIIAIILAQSVALIIILVQDFGFSCWNSMWMAISILLIIFLYINGRDALDKALQVLDLWIAGATNPRFGDILDKIHPIDKEE